MISKILENLMVTFLALAFVRFVTVCIGRSGSDAESEDNAESAVLSGIRNF